MKRRTAVILSAIVAVVLGGGAALTIWLLSQPAGPEATVSAYLSALERGDGAAASALSDPRTAADAPVVFDALAGASEWITEASTGAATVDDLDASVDASFTLDGSAHSVTIGLSNASGTWLVTAPPVATVVARSTLGAGVVLGSGAGISMPFDTEESVTFALLPGVYAITAAPAGLLDGGKSITAVASAPIEIALAPTLGEAATAAAQTQLTAYLAACTKPATTVPSACGIRVPWAADLATLSGLKFRIDAAPVLALAPDGSGFAATGGVLVATATGTTDAGDEASFSYRDAEWALRGGIAFTLDELVLEVW